MSLAVRTTPAGRALHATAPHPPAARLATYTSPILAIPTASARHTTCAFCLCADRPVTACTGCRGASYCSKACQRAAWKESHKLECAALANVPAGRELPTPVKALLRVVVRGDAWGVVAGLVGNEA
ncbi:zinc finger MYND domain-containing protein, partial [Candidatus Bathyarchaeota archaeon]|nr:zinc finger MYND domain-containing protein [Candidatus Bathyarchaeota archaeon]